MPTGCTVLWPSPAKPPAIPRNLKPWLCLASRSCAAPQAASREQASTIVNIWALLAAIADGCAVAVRALPSEKGSRLANRTDLSGEELAFASALEPGWALEPLATTCSASPRMCPQLCNSMDAAMSHASRRALSPVVKPHRHSSLGFKHMSLPETAVVDSICPRTLLNAPLRNSRPSAVTFTPLEARAASILAKQSRRQFSALFTSFTCLELSKNRKSQALAYSLLAEGRYGEKFYFLWLSVRLAP